MAELIVVKPESADSLSESQMYLITACIDAAKSSKLKTDWYSAGVDITCDVIMNNQSAEADLIFKFNTTSQQTQCEDSVIYGGFLDAYKDKVKELGSTAKAHEFFSDYISSAYGAFSSGGSYDGWAVVDSGSYIELLGATSDIYGFAKPTSGTGDTSGTGTDRPDNLNGTSSSDVLNGLNGNDKINGGAGNDTINGGVGIDKLTGGIGADTFVFDNISSSGASAADKILDFNISEGDSFVFDTSVFTALVGGITSSNIIIASKVKALDADDFILMTTKGKLYYDADGNGSGAAVLIAGVKGSFSEIDYTSFIIQ